MLRQFTQWLESGEKAPADLLRLCQARIAECEPEVRAWVEVRPQAAAANGPLRGIPFGAKDIFETPGMATEYGSPVYAGRKGDSEAALVTVLREAGAVLLGKTHTAAFAYFDPAPTRNPRDLRRTPGGSSSGSAAAVAAGMVPFALGTQTQGSILRPASYCGVTGFKPTFGRLPTEGILPFAPSLDTPGLFTQAAADMWLLWQRGFGARAVEPFRRLGVAAALPGFPTSAFETARVELPAGFERLMPAVRLINDYEGARTHRTRWERYGERIGSRLAQMVQRGLRIPEASYAAARAYLEAVRRRMEAVFREWPVLVTPAAAGPAPLGLESTGNPAPNAPWSGLGVPAISVPLAECEGLPVGLQLAAAWGEDERLLATAAALDAAFAGRPLNL